MAAECKPTYQSRPKGRKASYQTRSRGRKPTYRATRRTLRGRHGPTGSAAGVPIMLLVRALLALFR
jgi:hypothetical protein